MTAQVTRRPSEGKILFLLFLLALVVRLPGSGGDLWIDEIASLTNFMRPPLSLILVTYGSANNHVLYSILAHISISAFGEGSLPLRLPAILLGAAGAPALFLVARHFLARREAVAAALLLALSYHHAYFSQSARGYTGMIFLSLVSTHWMLNALEEGRRRDWALWAWAAALNIYMLLSGVFVCAGQVLGVLALRIVPTRNEARPHVLSRLTRWATIAAALTFLFYAPLLLSAAQFYANVPDWGWRPSFELLRVFWNASSPHSALSVAAILALPVAAVGFLSLLRRAPILIFCLVLPPFLELLVTIALGAGTYPRRFLLLLPFALLVAVRGCALTADAAAAWLGRTKFAQPLFLTLTAAGMLSVAAGLPRLYTVPKQDYRGALRVIAERRGASDLVAAAYIADTGTRFYDPSVRSARAAADLEALLAEGRTIWLVGTFLGDLRQRAPDLNRIIEDRFVVVDRLPGLVGDGDMIVWRSKEPRSE